MRRAAPPLLNLGDKTGPLQPPADSRNVHVSRAPPSFVAANTLASLLSLEDAIARAGTTHVPSVIREMQKLSLRTFGPDVDFSDEGKNIGGSNAAVLQIERSPYLGSAAP